MTPYQREIRDFLREYGATGVVLVSGSKHPRLAYTWRGKAMEYVIAGSSSDRRGSANAIADLKRRHPDGPIVPLARAVRKLDEMVEAISFNPIPLPDMDVPSPPSPVASTEIPADWMQPTYVRPSVPPPDTPPVAHIQSPSSTASSVQPTYNPRVTLAPIDRAFLKWLIDDINRVVEETDWRLARHPKTGRWRLFTVVE